VQASRTAIPQFDDSLAEKSMGPNNVVRNPKAASQEVELVLGDDARPKDHPYKSHIFSVDQYRDADYRLGN
jgi:hypothetical protein